MTRDTWLSDYHTERKANLGGSTKLKVKSIQEMSLLDIDVARLKGRQILSARLHLRLAGKERLHRITVSSFAGNWTEGTSPNYKEQDGSSSFAYSAHPNQPWAQPGSDLCAVMLSSGGTIWSTADASPPNAAGWQRIEVDPRVIGARVAGLSQGFLVFDDTGSEWTRQGEEFSYRTFPNRFLHSREAGPHSAPWFEIELGPADRQPPLPIANVAIADIALPAGEAMVTWRAPKDAVGFALWVNGKTIPRYLLPRPDEHCRLHIRDLGLAPGATIDLAVATLDGAGNRSGIVRKPVTVSDIALPALPGEAAEFAKFVSGTLPTLGNAKIAIVDALDKISDEGLRTPQQPQAYLQANHLWNARAKHLSLQAARNEFVAFQVEIEGDVSGLQAELSLPGMQAEIGELRRVGGWPDAVVPMSKSLDIRGRGALLGDVYVPHSAAPGAYNGNLTLRDAAGNALEIAVTLKVWNFTLPDHLSFLPEMNCYGLPANERDYYRLAHMHRTPLNRVPYGQSGKPAEGAVPIWREGKLDFRDWDRRFGPLLDGSAFADLPRKGVPLACVYLPLHENWPSTMDVHYNGEYWADRAFTPEFREAFVSASRQFAAHADAKGWHDTRFQCYQNNKVNFKQHGWSRGSSPWLLDEPANWQDYAALRYFAIAFHEGVNQAGGKAHMWYRGDISRPQWERDCLDGLMDYYVVGGSAFRKYHRTVFDRQRADGRKVITYGSANTLDASNMQAVGWCLDAWSLGADGVLPWQTIGREESWRKPDRLSLFYPGPLPSVRLKAFRRGQQDVEYLTLLAQLLHSPRWAVGARVREALGLHGELGMTGSGGEDAGVVEYSELKPQHVWALRNQIGRFLSEAAPPARSRLVELRTPQRTTQPEAHFVGPVHSQARWQPKAAMQKSAKIAARVLLQGRGKVADAIISPFQADATLGTVPRDNRLLRTSQASAMLLRFDLPKLPADRLLRATLQFRVWDPSNKGRAKVVALPLKQAWDEATVNWVTGWLTGTFSLQVDAGAVLGTVIVEPDQGTDTAHPPIVYDVDVTAAARQWLSGQPNHGIALTTLADRAVDDGHHTRFQVYASEYNNAAFGPSLVLELR